MICLIFYRNLFRNKKFENLKNSQQNQHLFEIFAKK